MSAIVNTAPVLSAASSAYLLAPSFAGVHAAAVGADGKVVTIGEDAVYRYLADGSLDTAFADHGKLALHADQQILGVTLTAGGKTLLAGTAAGGLALTRLNADGSLDTAFGKNGTAMVYPAPLSQGQAMQTIVLADGGLLVAATANDLDANGNVVVGSEHTVLTRLLANGALDTRFGKGGVMIDTLADFAPTQTVVQADGKIVCLGARLFPDTFGVVRFNADGTRDTSFGNGGFAEEAFAGARSGASSIALQPDGKLLVVGSSALAAGAWEISAMRLDANGGVDATFAGGGVLRKQITPDTGTLLPDGVAGTAFSGASAVHLRADGSILIIGDANYLNGQSGLTSEAVLLSLRADGSLDATFGTDGAVAIAPYTAGASFLPMASAVAADGSIDVFGSVYAPGIGPARVASGAMLHIHADGSIDHGFGAQLPAAAVSVVRAHEVAQALLPELTVTDAQLTASNYAGATLTVMRAGGADPLDEFSGSGVLQLANGVASVRGVQIGTVVNAGGKLVIHFTSAATQALVNAAVQAIAYHNAGTSDSPVQLVLTFDDGNSGFQGGGSNLSAQLTANVSWQHHDGLPWIDNALAMPAGAVQSAFIAAQRAMLGEQLAISVQFAPGFSAAGQLLANDAVARLLAVTGLHLDAKGTPIVFHPYALGADVLATSPLTASGADLYYSRGADSAEAATTTLLKGLERVFGLQHPDLPGTIETAALQALYGPSTAARTGNDVYQLDADHANFIWDGAGIDTISAAGIKQALTLHLEAGNWDYIGARGAAMTTAGQITINIGSAIENAIGGSGNDTFYGNALANVIDGGDGVDTVVFARARAAYTIDASGSDLKVSDTLGGADILRSIEHLKFADGYVSFDAKGAAGQIYRLFQAAFDRPSDAGGLGFWMNQMEHGATLASVATNFIASQEFVARFGAKVSNDDFLTALYSNVLHRPADAAGFAYWKGLLDSHAVTFTSALVEFSQSAENTAQLIGAMNAGMSFQLFT